MSSPEPPGAPGAGLPSAGLWRRFMSATYESVVLFAVVVFFGYAFSALFSYTVRPGVTGPIDWAFRGWLLLVLGVYFVWFWSRGRRTLPMKTFEVRLVDARGLPPTPARAAVRYLCAWATLLLPAGVASHGGPAWLLLIPVAFFWALFDGQRRTLYDRLSGTRLVVDSTSTRR